MGSVELPTAWLTLSASVNRGELDAYENNLIPKVTSVADTLDTLMGIVCPLNISCITSGLAGIISTFFRLEEITLTPSALATSCAFHT